MDYKRVLLRVTACALAFCALTLSGRPPSVQADTIEVNLTFDLKDSKIGGPVGSMGWSTPFISFPKVHPVAGDSLRISIRFVDQATNQPQRLKISDLGIADVVEQTFGRADGDPSLSVEALHLNTFTFHDVVGDILSNPVSVFVDSGGSGIGANAFSNLTNTAFSFTGITWQIDFSELTYLSGDGFNQTVFAVGGDQVEVVQNISVRVDIEPGPCPNRLNTNAHGKLRVSIQGTADFDVTTIDPASITLEGVAANRSALKDVSGQLDPSSCAGAAPDGFIDLTLDFDRQSIVAAIGDVQDGEVVSLTLLGTLVDGTPIQGQDTVVIQKKGKH